MIQLRPYQTDLVNQARSLMHQGHKSILIQSPTGSGKTALTAHMLHTAASKGMRPWFVVHRRELIEQSSRAFKLEGLPHGIISAGYGRAPAMRVQIAGVQTLARRFDRYPEPRLIVWDECHHIAAASWGKIFRRFPHAYHIGLTATPQRLDGQGLGAYFQKMIQGPTVSWLIENGFLSKYKLYAPANVDLSNVHKRMGDYARDELNVAMDKPKITGSAVEHYKKYAAGKRAIVFAVSVEHSKHIVEEFQKEGFNAAHVDGETDKDIRSEAIRKFEAGEIKILSNVELFGEGFNVPNIEVAILLRPTQSLGIYLQSVGRALRPSAGKENALIFDHVGNVERFGLPDDHRDWSLEGREKGKGEYECPIRICPACFAAQKPGKDNCIYCGATFPSKPRTIEHVRGELTEVDKAQLALRLKWKRQQGMAPGFKELIEIGKQKGYGQRSYGWAAMVMKGRAAKKMRGLI